MTGRGIGGVTSTGTTGETKILNFMSGKAPQSMRYGTAQGRAWPILRLAWRCPWFGPLGLHSKDHVRDAFRSTQRDIKGDFVLFRGAKGEVFQGWSSEL